MTLCRYRQADAKIYIGRKINYDNKSSIKKKNKDREKNDLILTYYIDTINKNSVVLMKGQSHRLME